MCGGFAYLTVALMRAVGIEAYVVIGCGYNMYDGTPTGHAWYRVYIDGMQITGDTTPESLNIFYNDTFSERQDGGLYFFDIIHEDAFVGIYVTNFVIF